MWWNLRWWGVAKFPSCAKCSYQEQAMDEVQWNPCITNVRGNQLDIIEVEIATPNGPLAILPPGKTIVTIGLKQL